MEYVEGAPIDSYCDERRLPIDARLELFARVCDAVQYAHRHRIIHRDLKPSNILVTEDGEVKLLDFGIATLLADGGAVGTEDAALLTGTGVRPMTPEYASPEQLCGIELSPASDVYSLGVLLYKLLTGRHPYRVSGLPPFEIARRIAETQPKRPSDDVSHVQGDLDTIVLTAMHRDPERRHTSAGQLAADVRKHLEGQRVSARPQGRGHHAWRVIRRHKMGATGAALGVVAVALGAALLFSSRASPVPSEASRIAVIPFAPTAPDTALARLGRDLVVTLSANLDGVGGIQTVDALTILARVEPFDVPPSLAEAAALARELGASSVVYGSVLRVGSDVRIDAALHPTDSGAPLARASVIAPPNDLAALTDSAALVLLRQLWQTGDAPTPSLAGLTTRSVPALRAFLEGERLSVAGRWRAAADAFEQAMKADSTFWLAYWRYASARGYWTEPVDSAVVATYRAHRFEFPERDRLLVEAGITDSLSVWYERTRQAAGRFPDHWPAWWSYSERLTHDAPLLGTTSADLRSALERTIALNPQMTSAWEHLMWVAIEERDTALASRVLQELTRLRLDSVSRAEQGRDDLYFYRVLDHLTREGGVLPDSLAEPAVRRFTSMTGTVNPFIFVVGLSQYGFFEAQIDFSRRVLRSGVSSSGVAAAQHLAIAIAQAGRGSWDSALVAMDDYAALVPDPTASLYQYRIAAVGAWLGALPADLATARRAPAARVVSQLTPAGRAEMAWLDGVLAVATRDTSALVAARRALRGTDSVTATSLDRSLHAFQLSLTGARGAAADTLVALERERAERGESRWRADEHPFLTAVDRLAAARWLLERGDAATAAPLLTWFENIPFPLQAARQADAMVQGLGYYERARVAEAVGQRAAALAYYRQFLRHHDAPVAAHRHLVETASSAVMRLSRD
jgi:TolB-like protein